MFLNSLSTDEGQVDSRLAVAADPCSTPSAKWGACIPAINCRSYWGRSMPDMANASCGEKSSLRVCCPLFEDDETTVTTDTLREELLNSTLVSVLPSEKLPEFNSSDRGRRRGFSVFPENCGQSGATLSRIVGGQDSILGAWPWMAVLYLIRRGMRSPECAGALITAHHVLTAAHCVVTSRRGQTFSPRQLLVRLGELNLESDADGANPLDIQVRAIIRHERFSLRTFQNDIAILELEQVVAMSGDIAPICLPFTTFFGEDLANRHAIAAGWGSTVFGGPATPHLQEVQLRIWNNSLCRDVFRREVPITEGNLCAGDGEKDACRGDSGGPLKLADSSGRYYLIGIVSFGRKCAEPGVPGVYTRVTAYLNWIEDHIG